MRTPDPGAVVRLVIENVPLWAAVEPDSVSVTPSEDTEWHELLFLESPAGKVVVNIPSWTGAELSNKLSASRMASGTGLAPELLAVLELRDGRTAIVSEHLDGGLVDLGPRGAPKGAPGGLLRDTGRLFGQFHRRAPCSWFETVRAELVRAGHLAPAPSSSSWASCLWVLPWLQRLVPQANRAELEAGHGVRWDRLAAEIQALPQEASLPGSGVTAETVCVHGDAHAGNIMWHQGQLRLIDFDMTAPGPAGSDLAYVVLMLFGCGFSPGSVLPRAVQRQFALGYLEGLGRGAESGGIGDDDDSLDCLLFDMHRWAYVGMLKMGLLCAILMHSEGNPGKREVMRAKGPVLLNAAFLECAKALLRESVRSAAVREDLLTRGLPLAAEEAWRALPP